MKAHPRGDGEKDSRASTHPSGSPGEPKQRAGTKQKTEGTAKSKLEGASVDEALSQLHANAERGLSEDDAKRRLQKYGPNAIEEKKKSPLLRLMGYFWGPIPWMLEVACGLSAFGRRWDDFGVILTMLLINVGVGYFHESRAAKAIEALKKTLSPKARVRRDGKRGTVEARDVVPGDVLILQRGDIVPADAKLLEKELSLDESALTGESLPVDKHREDNVYTGTTVKRGDASALVIATGKATRFGRTVELVAGVQERSHFEKAVLRIGYFLMAGTAVLVVVVTVVELLRGQTWIDVLVFALILTVAGIPVALPAVLSVTMAVGARRLAAQKAIVSRLAAMEELAGVRTLFSDKTGTLTLNELKLQDPVLLEADNRDELTLAAALTADRGGEPDAIDSAILSAVDTDELDKYKVQDFQPFDSTRKLAESRVQAPDGSVFRVAKGAPQVLLDLCKANPQLRDKVSKKVEELGANGFRALGVARAEDDQWHYLGLLSLLDPPRPDSADVIKEALDHGLDVRMVTGDHEAIARQVAGQVGLGQNILVTGDWIKSDDEKSVERVLSADGFAQVTPEDKYDLVDRFQRAGEIVAMTGDGVNDAPALRKADVGIAVSAATDAARAAADIVLTMPGLGVIIGAIQEARRIFARMVSYATYRIAETTRMVLFIAGAVILLGVYPVTAVMVALLAILNDIPIMTIATDNVRTPREPVRWNMRWVLSDAFILGTTGLIASSLFVWLAITFIRLDLKQLQTLIFLKLLVAGHLTIYVVRVRDWFWRKPWPSWKLLVALETTQMLGTAAAILGWLITPIAWWLVLISWGYSFVWLFILSAVRTVLLRKLRPKLEARQGEELRTAQAERAREEHARAGKAQQGQKPAGTPTS